MPHTATAYVRPLPGNGICTLRAVIQEANADTGSIGVVLIDIGGGGVQVIQPLSPLPEITDRLVIEGDSQPGYVSSPLIEVRGTSAGAGADGFRISGPSGSQIWALAITGFGGDGLELLGFPATFGNHFTSNYIGVRPDSTTLGNGGHGVHIVSSAINRIGGGLADPEQGNLIRGNGGDGIFVESGANHVFFRNMTSGNGGLGIDLAPDGVTANDLDDPDGGPNNSRTSPSWTRRSCWTCPRSRRRCRAA